MRSKSNSEYTALCLLRDYAQFTIDNVGVSLDTAARAAVEVLRRRLGADDACLHFVCTYDLDDCVQAAGLHRCAGPSVGIEPEARLIRSIVELGNLLTSMPPAGPFAEARSWALRFFGETFALVIAYYRKPADTIRREVLDAMQQLGHFTYAV
jgi:hypothetical protein